MFYVTLLVYYYLRYSLTEDEQKGESSLFCRLLSSGFSE